MRRIAVLLALMTMFLPAVAIAGQKSSNLTFLVIRDYNGKPVRNASVILHPVEDGQQDKGGFQLKTDLEGRTNFDGVPYGTLRIQVLAHGFQTFGQDYEINQATTEITIKLKRPGGQYSVYDEQKHAPDSAQNKQGREKEPDQK